LAATSATGPRDEFWRATQRLVCLRHRPFTSAKLSVDFAKYSINFQPVFVFRIGAKMEPGKEVQICLPRFASNRHGFELPLRCSARNASEKVNQ
jgi:hypothetical protein